MVCGLRPLREDTFTPFWSPDPPQLTGTSVSGRQVIYTTWSCLRTSCIPPLTHQDVCRYKRAHLTNVTLLSVLSWWPEHPRKPYPAASTARCLWGTSSATEKPLQPCWTYLPELLKGPSFSYTINTTHEEHFFSSELLFNQPAKGKKPDCTLPPCFLNTQTKIISAKSTAHLAVPWPKCACVTAKFFSNTTLPLLDFLGGANTFPRLLPLATLVAQGHNEGAGGGMGEQEHSWKPAHTLTHHRACIQGFLYAAQGRNVQNSGEKHANIKHQLFSCLAKSTWKVGGIRSLWCFAVSASACGKTNPAGSS